MKSKSYPITNITGQVIEKDWEEFFNKQLGVDNINTQIKLPTIKDIENKDKQIKDLTLHLEDANEANRILQVFDTPIRIKLEDLQDKIEDLNLLLEDAASNYCRLQDTTAADQASLNNKIEMLQLRLESETKRLKDTLEIEEKNRKHVTDLFEQKDAILNEAMKVVNQLRDKIIRMETDKVNAEHLAKKSIQLTDEISNLKTDYLALKSIYEEVKKSAAQLPETIIENTNLKEQLTSKDLLIISSKKTLGEFETGLATCKFQCESLQNAYNANKNLIETLIYNNHCVKSQNKNLFDALTNVTKTGMFSRRDVAVKALKDYKQISDDIK